MPCYDLVTRWYMETNDLTNCYKHNLRARFFSVGLFLFANAMYSYDVKVTDIRQIGNLLD